MAKLTTGLRRVVVGLVVAAVVAGGVYFVFFRGSDDKTVTAKFTEAVGLYVGTPVEVLGVKVGKVTSVKPNGTLVTVKMSYGGNYKVPDDAKAIEVANSLVSDRYIELTPAFKDGDTPMADGATIANKNTGGPEELDQVYSALSKLSVALGPKGANKGGKQNGALSILIKTGAANLKGNGAALGNSISNLSKAAQTLAGNRGNLFKTVANLRKFTGALKSSDKQVRLFNSQLSAVAGQLAGERGDLGKALQLLGQALDVVHNFVRNNAGRLHTTIHGLRDITSLLVRQQSSLRETLAVAPIALANITHSYNPAIGALSTRSNLSSLTNATTFCALLHGGGVLGQTLQSTLNSSPLLKTLKKQVVTKVYAACNTALKGIDLSDPASLQKLLGNLGNVVGGVTGGGGIGGLSLGGSRSSGLPAFPIGGGS